MLNLTKRIAIYFFMITFILSFANTLQAETIFVNDCLDENPDCLKQLDSSEKNVQENNADESSLANIEPRSLGFSVLRMIFSLFLILVLIYLLIKFLNKRQKLVSQVKSLENLGGIPVGQNKSIQIIRVGSKIYMIGVGDNVEMLKEITDIDMIDELLHNEEERDFGTSSLIKSLFQKKNIKDESSAENSKQNFFSLFSQELERLKQTRQQLKDEHLQKEDIHE